MRDSITPSSKFNGNCLKGLSMSASPDCRPPVRSRPSRPSNKAPNSSSKPAQAVQTCRLNIDAQIESLINLLDAGRCAGDAEATIEPSRPIKIDQENGPEAKNLTRIHVEFSDDKLVPKKLETTKPKAKIPPDATTHRTPRKPPTSTHQISDSRQAHTKHSNDSLLPTIPATMDTKADNPPDAVTFRTKSKPLEPSPIAAPRPSLSKVKKQPPIDTPTIVVIPPEDDKHRRSSNDSVLDRIKLKSKKAWRQKNKPDPSVCPTFGPKTKPFAWTPLEDAKLLTLLQQGRPYRDIAREMSRHSPHDCKERWEEHLKASHIGIRKINGAKKE